MDLAAQLSELALQIGVSASRKEAIALIQGWMDAHDMSIPRDGC